MYFLYFFNKQNFMRLKTTLNILFFLIGLFFSTSLSAQNYSFSSSDQKWKFGLNMGGAWQRSDVRDKLGLGGGLTLERAIIQNDHSTFGLSLRGRYLSTSTTGRDREKSYNIVNNNALNGVNDPSLNYLNKDGYVYHNYK